MTTASTYSAAPPMALPDGVPTLDDDFYDEAVLEDSSRLMEKVREAGGVVWLSAHNMFATGRYAEVRTALRAADTLISGKGVWANDLLIGENTPLGTLTADGELHDNWKHWLMKPMMPQTLQDLRQVFEREAKAVVDEVATGQEIEAIRQLASRLPTQVVARLIGLDGVDQAQLLSWAAMGFDAQGPITHPRTQAAMEGWGPLVQFATSLNRQGAVPGKWIDDLFAAAERGDLVGGDARPLILDYVLPSLDTTILAIGEILYRLATEDGLLALLKAEPELISNAVLESVRLATPIKGFTRHVDRDFILDGVTLPAGSRIWLINAAANRDPRRYPDPDRFDVHRNPRDQLGWGHGKHLCAGMHLAKLEMEVLLGEIVKRADSISVGAPARLRNSGLQGFAKLPMRITAA